MSELSPRKLSRRKLITTGIAAAAGVAGLGVATRIAQRYGLVPPDHGGIYGPVSYTHLDVYKRQTLRK